MLEVQEKSHNIYDKCSVFTVRLKTKFKNQYIVLKETKQ